VPGLFTFRRLKKLVESSRCSISCGFDEKRIGKTKPKKKVAMTYAQAEAIVRKGLEMG